MTTDNSSNNISETSTSTSKGSSKNSKDVYDADGRSNLLTYDPDKLTIVGFDNEADPTHPLFDKRATLPFDESLVRNIMHYGVIEPIVIRKNPENGAIEVVVGRQRVKATREANKRLRDRGEKPIQISAKIERGNNAARFAGIIASENVQRLQETPLGMAEKMQHMIDLGESEDNLAVTFGMSKASIKNYLSLLEATAAVRNAVEKNQINVSQAYQLAKLEPAEQRETVAKMIEAGSSAEPDKKGGKRAKAKKVRDAAGIKTMRGKREIHDFQTKLTGKSVDPVFAAVVNSVLDWVMGGPEPRIPRVATKQSTAA